MRMQAALAGAGAGLGAATGFMDALSAADTAEKNIARLGEYVTQTRVDALRNTERLSREAQVAIGNLSNVSPEGMSAMATISSQIVRGVASDQYAIETEASRREQAAFAEMESISDSVPNPIMSALGGAINMAGVGANLGGIFESMGQTQEAAGLQSQSSAQAAESNAISEKGAAMDRKAAEMRMQAASAEWARTFGLLQSAMRSPMSMFLFHRVMPFSVRRHFEAQL